MSLNPGDLPAAIYGPITPLAPSPWVAARDNEFAVHTLIAYTDLPAPTVIPRPNAVYVIVPDLDDLAAWLEQRGGEIHVSPPFEGVTTWTLYTHTPQRGDGSRVAIRVVAASVAGEPVMHDILAAVAA